MKTLTLTRTSTGDSGTFGVMTLPNNTVVHTGELPERDNKPSISCVPKSDTGYVCKNQWSPAHKANKYHVTGVPNREAIEIHSGNFCGDVSKGYQSDVLGCILLGRTFAQVTTTKLNPNKLQDAVTPSKVAVAEFEQLLNGEDFLLIIKESF